MPAGQYRTELPTMQAASQHVFQVNEQIQAQLTGYLAKLEPLAAQWQGLASMSHEQLKQRWHENAVRLNTALRSIGDALVATQQNYQTSEDTNQAGFTGISGVL